MHHLHFLQAPPPPFGLSPPRMLSLFCHPLALREPTLNGISTQGSSAELTIVKLR